MDIRFVSSVLLCSLQLNSYAQTKERPNILWIVSEDNTNTFVGGYGNKFTTTPNIDKFASEGIIYKNAFSTAPMSSPSRFTLITGMYPPSLGTDNMRSEYHVPSFVRFFPSYLREAGYYTSNNVKKDYNTVDQRDAWDESSKAATYKNRKQDQPFFAVFNLTCTHESGIFPPKEASDLRHNPDSIPLPPYHPATPEIKHDWAYYYDNVERMDAEVGAILKDLEESGLADNTIVFYYSDNGGVLGRSKRYVYESGLHVPLIVRFPEKYAYLAPQPHGTSTDRLVTFLDFAPTVLNLVGLPVPEYMQGKVFLGERPAPEQEYVYGFRSRMTERFDLYRSVRGKQYRYIRNYMPHKTYSQGDEYLMSAASMRSWEEEFLHGRTDELQSRFWKTKPAEELYDVNSDPDNIKNLANDPRYQKVLKRMRKVNQDWLISSVDAGFIPEAIIAGLDKTGTAYDYARGEKYDVRKAIRAAEAASSGSKRELKWLAKRLSDKDPVIRYWAVMGCIIHRDLVKDPQMIAPLLQDPVLSVGIIAAEAMYLLFGEKKQVIDKLEEALVSDNDITVIQALNVVDLMGDNAEPLFRIVRKIHNKDPQSNDYNARLARKILGYPPKKYSSTAAPFVIPQQRNNNQTL